MSREYSYLTYHKILWIALGSMASLLTVPLFLICLYLYFYENGDIVAVIIFGFITMLMVSTGLLAINSGLKTRLLINREGLELKSPTVILTVGWEEMEITEESDGFGDYLAVYSSEMEAHKIGLGHYMPGKVDMEAMMKGVPISRFIGDDRQEIINLLISFWDQE